jgi:hypothetical protein
VKHYPKGVEHPVLVASSALQPATNGLARGVFQGKHLFDPQEAGMIKKSECHSALLLYK